MTAQTSIKELSIADLFALIEYYKRQLLNQKTENKYYAMNHNFQKLITERNERINNIKEFNN